LNREKKGFGVPLDEWMRGHFGSFVWEGLFSSSLRRRNLFDYGFVKHLLTEHQNGRTNYSFFLWTLLNLSLWYERWIDGSAAKPQAAALDVTIGA
jgi:asparagine synthase (glutamine-hydrolysing)